MELKDVRKMMKSWMMTLFHLIDDLVSISVECYAPITIPRVIDNSSFCRICTVFSRGWALLERQMWWLVACIMWLFAQSVQLVGDNMLIVSGSLALNVL